MAYAIERSGALMAVCQLFNFRSQCPQFIFCARSFEKRLESVESSDDPRIFQQVRDASRADEAEVEPYVKVFACRWLKATEEKIEFWCHANLRRWPCAA